MFESQDDNRRSTIQVVLGFLLGIVVSLGCLFLAIVLVSALGLRQKWPYPVLDALGMVVAGIFALTRAESGYAQGVLIALSVALLLDAVCGVAILR